MGYSQLQSPFPSAAVDDPSALVRILATDDILITRPGSIFVASFDNRSDSLKTVSIRLVSGKREVTLMSLKRFMRTVSLVEDYTYYKRGF